VRRGATGGEPRGRDATRDAECVPARDSALVIDTVVHGPMEYGVRRVLAMMTLRGDINLCHGASRRPLTVGGLRDTFLRSDGMARPFVRVHEYDG
jgi:hypothetical protein